jgi:hypothetical protein
MSQPAASFPPERITAPEDLVAASLHALEMGEQVCIPSLPEIGDWEADVKAEQAVAANVSRDRVRRSCSITASIETCR